MDVSQGIKQTNNLKQKRNQSHTYRLSSSITADSRIASYKSLIKAIAWLLSLSHTFTVFAPVELQFIPNLLVGKVGVNRDGKEEKSSINTVSHDAPMVSARFVYGSATTHAGSATIHPD